MPRWVKRRGRWVYLRSIRGSDIKRAYRAGRKYWRRAPRSVKFASYFVPGFGQVRYGVQGARMVHGARLFKSKSRAKEAARYIRRSMGTDIAIGGSVAGAYYLYKKSRRKSSTKSSQQYGGPSSAPWSPQAIISRGSAPGAARTKQRGRERLPWCRVHRKRHWCKYTRK